MTDSELLKCYVRDRSEKAFTELVRRHINLIYSAALRQTNGDAHLAEDAAQMVFADLARKAGKLTQHTSLTGWLYTSTRFVAANLRRSEHRRSAREQEAHTMNAIFNATESEPDWGQIRPLIDEAMHTLDAEDREAVLMRHFQNRSYAEIGAAMGVTESGARMRVERALEKLHGTLTKLGVTSTAMALAGLLTSNAVGQAPTQLTAKVVSAALTGAATSTGVSVLFSHILTASKTKLALGAAALVTTAMLTILVASRHAGTASSEQPPAVAAPTNSSIVTSSTALPATDVPVMTSIPAKAINGSVLHLEIVTADTGKPVPMVPIELRGRVNGDLLEITTLQSDRFGICNVAYPSNIALLELTTRKDYFADTRLSWWTEKGDVIPTNYVLRLDRPVAIGGLVVDADGNPVAGAMVGWGHQNDVALSKSPQSHEFGSIQVPTDHEGRWQINRIAGDMIPRIYGNAWATNYVASELLFVGQDKTVEKQLLDGTYVFHLGRAVTVSGIVTDANGVPIPDADVLVGTISESRSRSGKTQNDGTFSIGGCAPGRQPVTAEADGYAVTTISADISTNTEPIRLTLKPGKMLRLVVADNTGKPIPNASVWLNTFDIGRVDPNRPKPVQVDFNKKTDRNGRLVWSNAPDAELTFEVSAPGYFREDEVKLHPDGKEHVVTLRSALVVHGFVHDALTGEPVPQFQIVAGWPELNPVLAKTNVHWSTIGRFSPRFAGGTYSNSFTEAVVGGTENRGYILKFLADGYAAFVSRLIRPDEGDVKLDVFLRRAKTMTVTAYRPDNRPAKNADVGLVSPGARLLLTQGGFKWQDVQTGGSLLETDAKGTFKLSPDDSILRVIVASPEGYAEATPAMLSVNPVLKMQPWGRLEANYVTGGKPIAGRDYRLELGGGSFDTVAFDYDMSRVTTDAQGHFSVSQLPPGKHELIRVYPLRRTGNLESSINGDRTPFEIRPGETTTLDLGNSSYTVTAKLQWPAGIQRQPQWRIDASLQTTMPTMPREVMTNQVARAAFMQTEDYKAAQQNAHRYPVNLSDDNTLSADEVKPGNYRLTVFVSETSGLKVPSLPAGPGGGIKLIAQASVNVTIPSNPPSGNLDAGIVELKAAPTSAR